MLEPYAPPPVPQSLSPEAQRYLDEELAKIAVILNHLLQYNEDTP